MSEFDKAWLESATLKELEDEVEELTDEIISISHQIDIANEFPGTKDRLWKHKAKMAKACKNADREKVRRKIREIKNQDKDDLNERRNRLIIARLRSTIGEDAFHQIALECKSMKEWQE